MFQASVFPQRGRPFGGNQSGNPLSPSDPNFSMHPGYHVPNFHRIVVHGSTFPLEWLKLSVDPARNLPATDTTFGPFSLEREIQQ